MRAFSLIIVLFFLFGCNADLPGKSFVSHEPGYENMVFIPAGSFIMGSDPEKEAPLKTGHGFARTPYANETPRHTEYVEAFYIDRYEVTFKQFKTFMDATHYPAPANWKKDLDFQKRGDYPVLGIRWWDAYRYAKWAGKRLPTEAEWEKAARGADGRRYPWGSGITPEQIKALTWLYKPGKRKFDRSPYSVFDLAGNVSEWTMSWYQPYRGSKDNDPRYGRVYRVTKGFNHTGDSGHYYLDYFYRSAYRGAGNPDKFYAKVGFRCAKSPPQNQNKWFLYKN
ncbi:MAG: formylglycine-generating enzyme family protein [bacterium]